MKMKTEPIKNYDTRKKCAGCGKPATRYAYYKQPIEPYGIYVRMIKENTMATDNFQKLLNYEMKFREGFLGSFKNMDIDFVIKKEISLLKFIKKKYSNFKNGKLNLYFLPIKPKS